MANISLPWQLFQKNVVVAAILENVVVAIVS
jgi:hypothetical protein